MKRSIFNVIVGMGLVAFGCMDREPAPVCPVPIEVASNNARVAQFDGVDLLVVIDNSGSMEEEQQTLSTGFFTLINSLVKPLESGWSYPAVENIRVAIVSSDMGFQYGDNRETALSSDIGFCQNNEKRGDDGVFLRTSLTPTTPVLSNVIECEPDGGQCPTGYNCVNGFCVSSDGMDNIACDLNPGKKGYEETTGQNPNPGFAERLACLARQGTNGCPFEQQLEASVRALEREEQKAFLLDEHLLAVLMVTDEEDCSIEDPGLFQAADWTMEGGRINVACNLNEQFLFDPSRYKERLISLKNGQTNAVIFAAIVGVPDDGDTCQGSGDQIKERGCLESEKMQLVVDTFGEGNDAYEHFRPACESASSAEGGEDSNDALAQARPGRRFVRVAQDFGVNGYVYSICNANWSPAMEKIAEIIARNLEPTCYDKQLDWEMLTGAEKNDNPHCENCGQAKCDVVLTRRVPVDTADADLCPAGLYEGLTERERERYQDMITKKKVEEAGSTEENMTVICPVPKLPAAIDCATANQQVRDLYKGRAGWYYCENVALSEQGSTCDDDFDNNGNDLKDCDDASCSQCSSCGGHSDECNEGCRYGVALTSAAGEFTAGAAVSVQCLQRFEMKDENCREASPTICNDGRDNDGNGVWDCDDTLTDPNVDDPHLPEPACCPMERDDVTGKCVFEMPSIRDNCSASPKLSSNDTAFWTDPANARLVDACVAHKEALDCEW